MTDNQLAEWLAARLNRCLPMDQWHRPCLEKLLADLRKSS